MKSKSLSQPAQRDLNTPEAVERFRRAAKAFNERTARTPESALQVLVEEGIYTKSGRLTKQYSQ